MKFLLSARDAKRFEEEGVLQVYKTWTIALGNRLIKSGWTENTPVSCILYCYALHTKYRAILKKARLADMVYGKNRQMKLVFERDNTADLIEELLEND